MNGTKPTGKTIGEVEKLTGIPKRELKYFIEQRMIRLSQKSISGYWLYDDADIQRARLAALCRKLGFPVKAIRRILDDPEHCWQEELGKQIQRLADRRDCAETQLHLAKLLENSRAWEALEIYCGSIAKRRLVSETDIGKGK